MNEVSDDKIVTATRKRVRRNALRPNSVECAALKEFSVLHSLSEKMDMSESDKRRRRETEENKEEKCEEKCEVKEERPETEETEGTSVTGSEKVVCPLFQTQRECVGI